MTKSKSKQEKGQPKGKQNAVNMGNVGRASANAVAAHQRIRKAARLVEQRRDAERQAGQFHNRVNEGRQTDLNAALGGIVGSYAYPGGNLPSVQFTVSREVLGESIVSVIRFEAVQQGHELIGQPFDPKVFVPCHFVRKFGTAYTSRRQDRLARATQELIVHYLARASGITVAQEVRSCSVTTPVEPPLVEETSEDPIFQTALTDYAAMLAEKLGIYRIPSPEGDVVVTVFQKGQKIVLRAVASKNPGVVPSKAFLPIYLLFKPALEQVTAADVYEQQIALFMFIRTSLGELISRSRTVERYIAPPPELVEVPEEAIAVPLTEMVPAALPPQTQVEEVDVTGHQPFMARQFLNKNEAGIFHHAVGGALAFFRLERIAGNQAFVLIAADDGHPLVPCLEAHREVHVHLQDLNREDGPYNTDMSIMRNARECVRQYLRQVGRSLGLGPKRATSPNNAETRSA